MCTIGYSHPVERRDVRKKKGLEVDKAHSPGIVLTFEITRFILNSKHTGPLGI